jgi:hypothetical protein
VTKKAAPITLSGTTVGNAPDSLLGPLVLDSPDLWDGVLLKKRARLT